MKAVEDLQRAGAIIVDPATVEGLDAIRRPQGVGPCMGFKYDINRYLAAHGDRVPREEPGRDHQVATVPPDRAAAARAGGGGTGERARDAGLQGARWSIASRSAQAVLKTMDAQKLDAFVYPTWSNPPRLIGDLNTPHGDNSQFFSPTTGFPAIQVPMGYTRGGDAAGRDHVLRARVGGGDADQARLRVRAGDAPPAAAGQRAGSEMTVT